MNANPTKVAATPKRPSSGSHPTVDPTRARPISTEDPSGSPILDPTHTAPALQASSGGVDLLDSGHTTLVPQRRGAAVDPLAADDRTPNDTHVPPVVGDPPSSQPPTKAATEPIARPSDGWLELRIWAEMFNDAQLQRIASVNRAERGGVDPAVYKAYTESLATAEHVCGLAMRRCYRRVVPAEVRAWQQRTPGIGEHLLARLLGHLGHPVRATPHHWEGTGAVRRLVADDPFDRTLGQLWQYCGHGAPGRPTKGMTADDLAALGSPSLKMLVHLLAEACMKVRSSPFRLVYEKEREAVEDKVHTVACVRCGPSGKPAQPGSPWNPGHQHAHALRIVGKEILRDLWIVAGGQAMRESQNCGASGDDHIKEES